MKTKTQNKNKIRKNIAGINIVEVREELGGEKRGVTKEARPSIVERPTADGQL